MLSKKWYVLIVALVIGSALLAACAPPAAEPEVVEVTRVVEREGETVIEQVIVTATPEPPEPEAPKRELEGLWFPIGTEPPTLDIQLATDTTSHLIIHQCIDGLFEYRGDGSIEPTGATGYTLSDDGLVYTVSLRDDAVWSDGVPVVAQQYVDGVIRLLLPETAAEYAWLMYDVEGAEGFNTGEVDDPELVGVKALDDYTLEITLKAPTSYFDTVLPFSTFYPVRLDIVEEYGDLWTEPGNYVSNGAYLLEAWEHEAEVVLVKNPTYWNAGAVKIEKITLPIIQESATALALYENGELHSSGDVGLPSEEMPRIVEDPVLSEELRILPRPGVYYVGLNTLRAPTDDVLVRKALAAAIDKQSIIDNVVQQPWLMPLSCTTPPKIMGYQEFGTCGYAFDPEQAQAFLAEAGYPGGEGFPVLKFWFNRADYNEDVIEAVAAMWEENLSINVELRTNEWAVYLDYLDACNTTKEELAACEFNAYRMGWVMDYGDPQNQLEVVFAPRSTFQYTGWESARFDELMELAGTEFDFDTREAYYKEADKILCEDEVAILPIHGYERNALVKTGITFEYPPFGAPAFAHWELP
ncbi:MAG TPA: peptide ABC transporter substrate-binding protein [Anaerolineae bacterium]|nr:peptide ABC transporter substrate-binding protein [Anaerolineae bacterium]